jgi:hypothetical protein
VIAPGRSLHAFGRGRKHSRGRRDDRPPIADELPRPAARNASAARCRDSARALPDGGGTGRIEKLVDADELEIARRSDDPAAGGRGRSRRDEILITDERCATTERARVRRTPRLRLAATSARLSNPRPDDMATPSRSNSRRADRIREFGATRVPGRRSVDSDGISANGSSQSGRPPKRSGGLECIVLLEVSGSAISSKAPRRIGPSAVPAQKRPIR